MHLGTRFVVTAALLAAVGSGAFAQDPKSVQHDVLAVARNLADDDPAKRRAAAEALGGKWPDGARAVPALLEALEDEDDRVRTAAASALGALERSAVPALIPCFDALAPKSGTYAPADEEFLQGIFDVLSLGPAATPRDIVGALEESRTPLQRGAALLVVAAADPYGPYRSCWGGIVTPMLKDPKHGPAAAAVPALRAGRLLRERGLLPPQAAVETPERWLAALRSASPVARLLAAQTLHRGRSAATAKALSAAVTAETARGDLGRDHALVMADALGAASDPKVVGAVPPPEVASSDALVVEFANGLCRLASADEAAALLDVPWAARFAAIRLAADRSPPASAEAGLRRVLLDPERASAMAAIALSRLGPKDATDLLTKLDERRELLTRGSRFGEAFETGLAAWVLRPTPERMDSLRKLREAYPDCGALVLSEALPILGTGSPALVKGLALADGHTDTVVVAALGAEGAPFVQRLLEEMEPDPGAPESGRRPFADASRNVMFELERLSRLRALAAIGPAASAALPKLDAWRKDPIPQIAVAAARAARAIRRAK